MPNKKMVADLAAEAPVEAADVASVAEPKVTVVVALARSRAEPPVVKDPREMANVASAVAVKAGLKVAEKSSLGGHAPAPPKLTKKPRDQISV